jgi:hypothetical protein
MSQSDDKRSLATSARELIATLPRPESPRTFSSLLTSSSASTLGPCHLLIMAPQATDLQYHDLGRNSNTHSRYILFNIPEKSTMKRSM